MRARLRLERNVHLIVCALPLDEHATLARVELIRDLHTKHHPIAVVCGEPALARAIVGASIPVLAKPVTLEELIDEAHRIRAN